MVFDDTLWVTAFITGGIGVVMFVAAFITRRKRG